MGKRFFLAIAVSLLILLSWSAFISKIYHIDNKVVRQDNSSVQVPVTSQQPSLIPLPADNPKTSILNFQNDAFEITFDEHQAAIQDVVFKSDHAYKFELKHGFLLGDGKLQFKKESIVSNIVSFVHVDQEKRITKKFDFSNSNYDIRLEIAIKNLTSVPLVSNSPLFLGALDFSDQELSRFKELTILSADKVLRNNGRKDIVFNEVKLLGLRDRYFCAIIEPVSTEFNTGFVQKMNPQISEVGLYSKETSILPNQEIVYKFHIYLGPQKISTISSINPDWTIIVNYGTFNVISQFLLQILEFFYRMVHNWGVAIIILSIVIYFSFYPLTLKQMRSMKEMQALQPLIEELRRNYKDNPQRLNKEIMELYRKHKVNPFSGCLPLLLQMPIFFALYQALMRSIALRGANFLWIKDLSQPDRLFILPISLPILGNEINILPIIMTIGMFVQQKISGSATSNSSTAEQQKLMLIIMPLMFGLIFYHMPAGLVLYWFVNSILMLVYQIRINKVK